MHPRLVFLIYDSRSGSTYFSRKLDSASEEIVVTPEINLVYLLKRTRNSIPNWDQLAFCLEKGRFFSSLGLSKEQLKPLYSPAASNAVGEFIRKALSRYAETRGKCKTKLIVIKKGDHAKVYEDILKVFPDAIFLYLRRDPRAIYSSKKRTSRPYKEKETMGWAGVLAACLRWTAYENAAKKIEKKNRLMRIDFESLASDEMAVMVEICEGLDVKLEEQNDTYMIAEKEQLIHAKAHRRSIDVNQIHSWRGELTGFEKKVMDLVLGKQLRQIGYSKKTETGMKDVWVLGVAVCDLCFRLFSTYLHRWIISIQESCRR